MMDVDDNSADWKAKVEALERQLGESQQAFDEFQAESRELEKELEREVNAAEQRVKDLTTENLKTTRELHALQDKHTTLKEQWSVQIQQLEVDVASLRARDEEMRSRIRTLEQANDDVERERRALQSSLAESEAKCNRAIERNVLLEQEVEEKQAMRDETQRLRDELRDVLHELEVLKKSQQPSAAPAPAPAPAPAHPAATAVVAMDATPALPLQSPHTGHVVNTSASPVLMVQDVIQRVKSMESRLAACRSLVAPLIAPAHTY